MNTDDGTVSRVDPRSYAVARTVAIGPFVSGIATGAGAVWASEPIGGKLSRIDPSSQQAFPIAVAGGGRAGAPGPVAVGAGAVWVAVDIPADELVRVDPTTNAIVRRIHDVAIGDLGQNREGAGAVVVGSGSVWVSTPDRNVVLRIDPRRNAVVGRVQIPDGPAAIAFGSGAVWVVVPSDDTLWRIDSFDNSTRPIHVGKHPTGVAVGEGSVWVANEAAGTVSRIDPRSGTVVTTIRVGHSPGAVAVGYGKVWVGVRTP
jgi:YVTN family beta-propeller protein